jgi:maltooligosyltrehalose trehalohydrolase
MGQEFAASSPFLYFTDHPEALGRLVTEGRRNEFAGFRAFHDDRMRTTIPDPQAQSTFLRSKLDLNDRTVNAGVLKLYKTLISMRRNDPVLRSNDRARTSAHAITAEVVLVHRWANDEHRLMIANFGSAIDLSLAGNGWNLDEAELTLTTSDRDFFGTPGIPSLHRSEDGAKVRMPGRAAAIWSFRT